MNGRSIYVPSPSAPSGGRDRVGVIELPINKLLK